MPLTQSQLPMGLEQEFVVYDFSPDGKWLAYSPLHSSEDPSLRLFETPMMILLSYTGERIEHPIDVSVFEDELRECCLDSYFDRLSDDSHWINNELLYMELFALPVEGSTGGAVMPEIFDPFAGVWLTDWLDALSDRPGVGTFRDDIGISPDLSRVLYPFISGEGWGNGIILRDLTTKNELWFDPMFAYDYGILIRWSPDSSVVAVANRLTSRLLLISRDGDVREEIANSSFLGSGFNVEYLAWSPDGRYLALIDDYEIVNDVYIYDTVNDQYIYRCPLTELSDYFIRLIWSPDGAWIALTALDSPLQVLNVQTGEVIQLLDDAIAVGWSDKFPTVWP